MGWERRQRGGWYYTRKQRIGARVVTEYVGAGLAGMLAAEVDGEERAKRLTQREALRGEQERWETVDGAVAELCGATDLMARAALLTAGYHQHHRGEWRRRRGTQAT